MMDKNEIAISTMSHQTVTGSGTLLQAFFELTKPRLLSMVILSAGAGYFMAAGNRFDLSTCLTSMICTALVGGGSMALNEWMERESDQLMKRTETRPLPTNRITDRQGFLFGLGLSLAGLSGFLWFFSRLTFVVALVTLLSYLIVYTPLKKKTSLATFFGAIPGALPPVIGWASAGRGVDFGAVVLFLILFFWQMPHFLAINWIYRDDYERAGFPTLAGIDPSGKISTHQMIVNTSALLCVSLLPTVLGFAGPIYFVGAFVLGICFAAIIVTSIHQLDLRARFILRASIVYLTLLYILMMIDRVNV